ncbi:ABC transporter permease [Rhodoligotrophos ferricapiens]|uniref:ABC transporter permease n=1 Tax=Rhodoligotrophos ferricapiens TaxID=3069264 RepID=UPI00315C6EC4
MRRRSDTLLNIYVGLVLLFLALPIAIVIPAAFNTDPTLAFPPKGLSLKWFETAWNHQPFWDALWITIAVAVLASAISLIIGTLASFAIVRHKFPGREMLELLFMTPLVFPAIVLAVALVMVLGPLGLVRTFWGLVFAHVIVTVPYVVRTVGATLSEIDIAYEEAARTLGANPLKAFFLVTLPMLRPGLIAGAVFAAIISFDEFTISLFLVGPGVMTLPLEIYYYTEFQMDPTVAAISAMLVAFTAVVIVLVERFIGMQKQFRH